MKRFEAHSEHRLRALVPHDPAKAPHETSHTAKCSCGKLCDGLNYTDALSQWQAHSNSYSVKRGWFKRFREYLGFKSGMV